MKSTIDQSFEDWELIVADGASTDGTVELLEEFAQHITWWRSEPDEGIYDAWNKALPHAHGEYVCFLGADDAWSGDNVLQTTFAAIGDSGYDLVTSSGLSQDSSTGKSFSFGSAWDYARIGPRTVICHPGLLHRRTLFDAYGLFDTQFKIAGDLDFLLRLPGDISTLHVDHVSVIVEAAGISRRNVIARLREQREVLKRCPRYGPVRAYLTWLNKLWRMPIARIFGLSH